MNIQKALDIVNKVLVHVCNNKKFTFFKCSYFLNTLIILKEKEILTHGKSDKYY